MADARPSPASGTNTDTATHQHQDSMSHTASTNNEGVDTDSQSIVKIAESADEGSPRPNAPSSRATKGFCRNCRNNVGEFYNSWHKITGSYYVPALLGSYSTTLKSTGKQKAASKGTDLEGCTIQPLSCPNSSCTDSPIGFTVVQTPTRKGKFRGRDFFKLSRIELQCEIANQHIVVEPQEDAAPDLSTAENSPSPSAVSTELSRTPPEAMEVASRLNQSLPAAPSRMHSPFMPSSTQNLSERAPSNAVPSTTAVSAREAQPSQHASLHYPLSSEAVGLDAIERLQTQISQNSGALAAHTRDIRRGEESFQQLEETLRRDFQNQLMQQSADIKNLQESTTRLHHEMQMMGQMMEGLSREMHAAKGSTVPHDQLFHAQDSALELMAQQIAAMSHKTNEVDTLRVTIEIMKNKIQRLEGNAAPVSSQPTTHAHQTQHESVVHSSRSNHNAGSSYHATPGTVQQNNNVAQTPPNVPSHHSLGGRPLVAVPESTHRAEPVLSQSTGWATINAGAKRNHSSGAESPLEAIGSPKRQRIADAEPSASYASSQAYPHGGYGHMSIEGHDPRFQTPAHTVPSQHAMPESTLGLQSQQSSYTPYGTQNGLSDDSWRAEPKHITEHRPRGRPRGGPGSRGGRGRKSMPAQLHPLGTPEWEREEWQGAAGSQTTPDGHYSHVAHAGRGGIARRGSGGGGTRGGYAPNDRAASLGLQGVGAGIQFESPGEAFGSSKRTRTKPIRNADGVLIRKDGRPDMRSQSSAANLRKVHARKEGEASHSPTGFTPTNLQYATSVDAPDTPSPSGYTPDPGATDKHNVIMGKMFPSGVDASRKQNDYTRQVFEENHDHTVHRRAHNHHTATKDLIQIKKEQVEHNHVAKPRSPKGNDVDINHDRRRIFEEQSDGSVDANTGSQAHEATTTKEGGAETIPETQEVDTSTTLRDGSIQAS